MIDPRCLREFLATVAAILFASLILHGCGGTSIRERDVYASELSFVEAASSEQSMRGISLIAEYCECDEDGFTTQTCGDLAETILVVQARLPYHVAFMRFLGGLTDERPGKNPPDVPGPNALCVATESEKIREIDDYPDFDAGIEDGGEL